MESKDELLHTIEERHHTAQLGRWDHESGRRYSQVGNVGEALKAAAERAERLAAEANRVIEDDIEEWFNTQ